MKKKFIKNKKKKKITPTLTLFLDGYPIMLWHSIETRMGGRPTSR